MTVDRITEREAWAGRIHAHMRTSSSPSLRVVDLIRDAGLTRPQAHAGLAVLVDRRIVIRVLHGVRYALRERSERARGFVA